MKKARIYDDRDMLPRVCSKNPLNMAYSFPIFFSYRTDKKVLLFTTDGREYSSSSGFRNLYLCVGTSVPGRGHIGYTSRPENISMSRIQQLHYPHSEIETSDLRWTMSPGTKVLNNVTSEQVETRRKTQMEAKRSDRKK